VTNATFFFPAIAHSRGAGSVLASTVADIDYSHDPWRC
jgi:hypothetical protein